MDPGGLLVWVLALFSLLFGSYQGICLIRIYSATYLFYTDFCIPVVLTIKNFSMAILPISWSERKLRKRSGSGEQNPDLSSSPLHPQEPDWLWARGRD